MPTISKNFEIKRLKKVKLFALDFDGVMTDGCVYTDRNGNEIIRTSRRDSLGILMLRRTGIKVVVITTETSPIALARCKKLDVPCFYNSGLGKGKLATLIGLANKEGLSHNEIAYMGDDLNDLKPMRFAGVKITVADGHSKLKEIAGVTTKAKGGNHAVREICDLILRVRGISEEKLLDT